MHGRCWTIKHCEVGEVAMHVVVIKPITNDELSRDRRADIVGAISNFLTALFE
jgi:hypothetical protein